MILGLSRNPFVRGLKHRTNWCVSGPARPRKGESMKFCHEEVRGKVVDGKRTAGAGGKRGILLLQQLLSLLGCLDLLMPGAINKTSPVAG